MIFLDQNKGAKAQSEMNSKIKGGMLVCIFFRKVKFQNDLFISLNYFYLDIG